MCRWLRAEVKQGYPAYAQHVKFVESLRFSQWAGVNSGKEHNSRSVSFEWIQWGLGRVIDVAKARQSSKFLALYFFSCLVSIYWRTNGSRRP